MINVRKTKAALQKGERQYAEETIKRAAALAKRKADDEDLDYYKRLEQAKITLEETKKNAKISEKEKKRIDKVIGKIDEKRGELIGKQTKKEQERWKDDEQFVDDARRLEMDKIKQQIENLGKLEEKTTGVIAEIEKKVQGIKGRITEGFGEAMEGVLGKGIIIAEKLAEAFGKIPEKLKEGLGGLSEFFGGLPSPKKGAADAAKRIGAGTTLKAGDVKIQVGPNHFNRVTDDLDMNQAGRDMASEFMNHLRQSSSTGGNI